MDTPYSLRRVAIGVRSDGTFQPVSSLDCSLGSSIQTYLLLSDKGRKPPVMKSLQFTFESGPNEQNYTRLVDIFVEYLRQSGIPFFTSNGIDINSNPSYRIGMLKPESLLQSKIKSLNVPTVYTIMGAMHDPHKLHDVI
ncbi:hypothetical protein HYU10_02725, partial [Candidatus Woesearchaeota archaeon]|nr:hypothetical protein [Candidatus Woesearchaeota archaeon]